MSHAPVYYHDYLKLDQLLTAQQPLSQVHDEMLFIISHQAFELWFKQINHELDAVRATMVDEHLNDLAISMVVARLKRVVAVQRLMDEQINVLCTMTPMDFLEFRDKLLPASGFQSVQFRLLENKWGVRKRETLAGQKYHERLSKAHHKLVLAAEEEPSVFNLVDEWLARMPFLKNGEFHFWSHYSEAVENMLQTERESVNDNPFIDAESKQRRLKQIEVTRDQFQAMLDEAKHKALQEEGHVRLSFRAMGAALFIYLYRDQPMFHQPYQLLAALVEIDELMTRWRYRHAQMVQRMIGHKVGTGGTSGHEYLMRTTHAHRVFDDLTSLSTLLIPRSALPELPEQYQRWLDFAYNVESMEAP